jgi:hypothetical protein
LCSQFRLKFLWLLVANRINTTIKALRKLGINPFIKVGVPLNPVPTQTLYRTKTHLEELYL